MNTQKLFLVLMWLLIPVLGIIPESQSKEFYLRSHLKGLNIHLDDVSTNSMNLLHGNIEDVEFHLEHNTDSGSLEVRLDPIMNRTVYTTNAFRRGEYICEYAGELIDAEEADRRVKQSADTYLLEYTNDIYNNGDHMGIYNVDAAEESGRFCRLINHSRKLTNVDVFPFLYRNQVRLLFLATRDIPSHQQLFFDYGFLHYSVEDFVKNPWLLT